MGRTARALALLGLTASAGQALAQAPANGDPRAQMRPAFDRAVKGKTVAWVPLTLSTTIGMIWTRVMRENFERYGVNFVVRDPNFSADAQLQAVNALIAERPDVLIVQNANVSVLARPLKRAMEAGIPVVQVNMMSNTATDAYVGVDNVDLGRTVAQEIVGECGGGRSSGKVALVQGEATAAASLEQLQGAMEVFEREPSIKVVSSQAANWDSNRANAITATVLQQHPDLCATYGVWGTMQQGAAQAVKAAGLQGKVKVYATTDGPRADCDAVEQGLFHKVLSYRSDVQGVQITDAVLTLLQNRDKPGTKQLVYLSNSTWVAGRKDRAACFDLDPPTDR
ncbi:ABC transporter substrate-binding protein [Methylobacterium sp. Leaf456]|uniref:sugar ABC transporter substrate-binding protein n=1 Tax=Methylobacterium sp. Leaf456 TaxID=1736382 RepID=UPI0006FDC7F4|nr:sugar ABC transporter substrate-binding protein [Methylobacterium sp. Leaf456]KQT59696.1 ABC transporter substrate-binding protein [Methylobacterium sp. Leaf456]